jgi:DNA-binding protein H-NS
MPKQDTGNAASEAAKKTTPEGAQGPDPKALGDEYKKNKDAQEEEMRPGLLDGEAIGPGQEGTGPLNPNGLLEDGDVGPAPEDFELMAAVLDALDEEDLALIELLTGLPVLERISDLEEQAANPDGENPPDLIGEVAKRQVETEQADPLNQAKKGLEEEQAAIEEAGSAPSSGQAKKKKPASTRPTVTAAKQPNWVAKHGGLPQWVKRTAQHLKKKGFAESHAIAVAINAAKKMCGSGDTNWPGKQNANGKSRAETCADVAHWESMKAAARAD